jgi:hypothetical protein
MLKPTTYNELLEEKKKLEAILVSQKGIVKNDLAILYQKITPTLEFISKVGRLGTATRNNPIVSVLLNITEEIFLENMLLSKSSRITRFVVPFLLKNAASFFLKIPGKRFLKNGLKKKPVLNDDEPDFRNG